MHNSVKAALIVAAGMAVSSLILCWGMRLLGDDIRRAATGIQGAVANQPASAIGR